MDFWEVWTVEAKPQLLGISTSMEQARAAFDWFSGLKVTKRLNTKFPAGNVVVTQGVADLATTGGLALYPFLRRHLTGDWGDMDAEGKKENDFSVGKYLRIFSAYKTPVGKIWIITEADRSVTTILLPEEY